MICHYKHLNNKISSGDRIIISDSILMMPFDHSVNLYYYEKTKKGVNITELIETCDFVHNHAPEILRIIINVFLQEICEDEKVHKVLELIEML